MTKGSSIPWWIRGGIPTFPSLSHCRSQLKVSRVKLLQPGGRDPTKVSSDQSPYFPSISMSGDHVLYEDDIKVKVLLSRKRPPSCRSPQVRRGSRHSFLTRTFLTSLESPLQSSTDYTTTSNDPRRTKEKERHPSSRRTKGRLAPTSYPTTSGPQRKVKGIPEGIKDVSGPKDNEEST